MRLTLSGGFSFFGEKKKYASSVVFLGGYGLIGEIGSSVIVCNSRQRSNVLESNQNQNQT